MPVQETNIAWTDYSANHWVACAKTSEGCRNCWAADVADRFDRTPEPWTIANIDENLSIYDEDIVGELAKVGPGWCFYPSSSDPFLPWLPDEVWEQYWQSIFTSKHLCFQVLTKWGPDKDIDAPILSHQDHVMLGVTVENARRDYRIDWLRDQDAETKFVSFEPLLDYVGDVDLTGIDWAIIGGESGTKRRWWMPSLARQVIRECRDQDVAVFFKQHGDRFPEERIELYGDVIREFPEIPADVPPKPEEYLQQEVVA